MRFRPFIHIVLVFSMISLACGTSAKMALTPTPSLLPPTPTENVIFQKMNISADKGGIVNLPDGASVRVPPNSLEGDEYISIVRLENNAYKVPEQDELNLVGPVYEIDLGNTELQSPVTLELPFELMLLPEDIQPDQLFLAYFDESNQEWEFAGGIVDLDRQTVTLQTNHASKWAVHSWNWSAWVAFLSKILQVKVVELVEAVQLLTDDCPQKGGAIYVDSSLANNVVQGCVERDDPENPELRIINPKSFFFEISQSSPEYREFKPSMLGPGEEQRLVVDISDPRTITISAAITQKSMVHLLVHLVLITLPGLNDLSIQSKNVACLTERLGDASDILDAAESLLLHEDGGLSAAESLRNFYLDEDAVSRFIKAADDCDFGPAKTWSIPGIKQISSLTSALMSEVDVIANFIAGNAITYLSFVWVVPEASLPEGYDLARIGSGITGAPYELIFDTSQWEKEPYFAESFSLEHKTISCSISQNSGGPDGGRLQPWRGTKTFGEISFDVMILNGGEGFFRGIYTLITNSTDYLDFVEIKVSGKDDRDACIIAAEGVLSDSVELLTQYR